MINESRVVGCEKCWCTGWDMIKVFGLPVMKPATLHFRSGIGVKRITSLNLNKPGRKTSLGTGNRKQGGTLRGRDEGAHREGSMTYGI